MFLKYFTAFLFSGITFCAFAQTPTSLDRALLPQNNEESAVTDLPPRSTWEENIADRTLNSRSWRLPDGRIVFQQSKRPVCYSSPTGELLPVDPDIRPCDNGWHAPFQMFPTFIGHDGRTELSIGKELRVRFNMHCKLNGNPAEVTARQENNKIRFANFFNGVDKEILVRENSFKTNYILHAMPTFSGPYLDISEEVEVPHGYLFSRLENGGKEENGGWSGDLSLLGPGNEEAARFSAPICFDANGNWILGTWVMGLNEQNKKTLSIRVPRTWLEDPQRSFPIVIDPLVIGPTTTWTGGQMPSCIVPVYNADSILVTVPAGISIVGLFVTSSYYASPFTTAVMADGALRFRTSCATSTTFTVALPQGNTPGTAYLDSFDLKNPLMCCMQNACTTRTFWLTMLLGRTQPSTGCNTTYIRYDPLTTSWPFSALVVGRTPEGYQSQWVVPTVPICGNVCNITCTAYIRYGVPPYTLTHPWMVNPVTQGSTNMGCSTGAQMVILNLTVPGCPRICDTTSSIQVPPPTVVDACGATVSGLPTRTLQLKQVPDISGTPVSQTICSGDPFSVSLSSCISSATTNWFGNSMSGTGNFGDTLYNTGNTVNTINFSAYASYNGCNSDTAQITVDVDPLPQGDYSYSPSPVIAAVPSTFTDMSQIFAGNASSWSWNFGDNSNSTLQDPVHTYADPGTYTVCLTVITSNGCVDSVCKVIEVIAPDVILPNVITPNADNSNDFLAFQYLDAFPANHLQVFNRWGALLFEKDGYLNDWSPDKISNGTYYFVLYVADLQKTYAGWFEVLK